MRVHEHLPSPDVVKPPERWKPRRPRCSADLIQGYVSVVWPPQPETGFPASVRKINASLTIGRGLRGRGCLSLDDETVSRKQCRLVVRGDALWLEDMAAVYPPRLNGVEVRQAKLCDQDLVRVGGSLLLLTYDPPLTAPRTDHVAAGAVACSPQACTLFANAAVLAGCEQPALLVGPTGSGKEVLARFIHATSGRTGPFQVVNCATLPPGLIDAELFGSKRHAYTGAVHRIGHVQTARGGTLHLDEIGELTSALQGKLLRLIQNKEACMLGCPDAYPVDVRIVATTNRQKNDGTPRLRDDLVARFEGGLLRLLPLAEHRADIIPLASHFLAKRGLAVTNVLDADAAEYMLISPWPRNARQVEMVLALPTDAPGVMEKMSELRLLVAPEGKPQRLLAGRDATSRPTRSAIRELLRLHRGSITKVAAQLGVDRKQVYRWLDFCGLGSARSPRARKRGARSTFGTACANKRSLSCGS